MKCPLLVQAIIDSDFIHCKDGGDCLKEECGWWVKASQSCAMEAIPRVIGYVGITLKELGEKMPQDERTREKV